MACRDLGHNPAQHHFVSDFLSRPVADRTFFRLLAGQRYHLTGLLGGNMGRFSWAWNILHSFPHGDFFQWHYLQADPARTPTANRVHTDSQISGYLAIIF